VPANGDGNGDGKGRQECIIRDLAIFWEMLQTLPHFAHFG
jgi:hypothetical protein